MMVALYVGLGAQFARGIGTLQVPACAMGARSDTIASNFVTSAVSTRRFHPGPKTSVFSGDIDALHPVLSAVVAWSRVLASFVVRSTVPAPYFDEFWSSLDVYALLVSSDAS